MIFIDFWGSKAWNFGKNCLDFDKKLLWELNFQPENAFLAQKIEKMKAKGAPRAPQEAPRRLTGGPRDIGPDQRHHITGPGPA